jgi:hypothetical protein
VEDTQLAEITASTRIGLMDNAVPVEAVVRL